MPAESSNSTLATDSTPGDAAYCPACLAVRTRPFGHKGAYAFLRCTRCGSVFTCIAAVDRAHGTLKEMYDHYYDGAHFQTCPATAHSLDRLVRSCRRYRRSGNWLDMGYGEGGLLSIAEAHGWRCFGTEVSPPALAHGQRLGWIVSDSPEGDARFPVGGFDVVSLVEVIEHVEAPDEVLSAAARWLRPGGLLYVTTPNARSLNTRVQGARWSVFSPPEHLTIWSRRGLNAALARAGFRTIRARTTGFNPCEIIALARARFRRSPAEAVTAPVNRNETAFRLNDAFSRTRLRRAAKAAVNLGLSAFEAGDGLKIWGERLERLQS